ILFSHTRLYLQECRPGYPLTFAISIRYNSIMILYNRKRESENFVTTNLRLPKARLQELRLRALNEGASIAELVRQAIDAFLGYERKRSRKKRDIKQDPFFEVVGMGKSGLRDGS